METGHYESNRTLVTTNTTSMGFEPPAPIQIDVSLAVEKEMTSALTGPVKNPAKTIQQISDRFSLVTQEGSNDVETLIHYKCEQCKESFILSNKYKAHCLDVHGITNPYKCTDCDNTYTNESAMRVHLRTHKNHKPYVCEECGRSFAQCSTWMAHVVRHSGATPHICEVCGKAFATKGDLATHSRIHLANKPFSCDQCGLSFPRKSNYTRHMRKHTGEKPYACEFCSKRFARSENCKEHERLHTKERPYVCDLCGMTFGDSGNFSKHKKNHMTSKKPPAKNQELQLHTQSTYNDDIGDTGLYIETSENHLDTNELNSVKEKGRKSRKQKKTRKEIEPLPEPQSMAISLVRQPIMLAKPMSVTFNNIVVPLTDTEKSNPLNGGFIKITADNFVDSDDSKMATDPCLQPEKSMITNPLIGDSEALKLPSYQLPVFVSTQPATNSILTDLNYSSNSLNNQTFMMLDYYSRDSSFSFTNDGNLILQETPFNRSPNLAGADSFIYGTSLVSNDLTATADATNCGIQTDFTLNSGAPAPIFTPASNFDDDMDDRYKLAQPLDTNKFLNEQYLIKKLPEVAETTNEDSLSGQ